MRGYKTVAPDENQQINPQGEKETPAENRRSSISTKADSANSDES